MKKIPPPAGGVRHFQHPQPGEFLEWLITVVGRTSNRCSMWTPTITACAAVLSLGEAAVRPA